MYARVMVVCGGRTINLEMKDYQALDGHYQNYACDAVFIGDASGVDSDVRRWADIHGHACEIFMADRATQGKRAEPIRNRRMLQQAGDNAIVIAFPGGKDTAHTRQLARKMGKIVHEYG